MKWNENGKIKTDNTEIQKILRNYYDQFYANKMDNGWNGQFLENYNLPNLNQGKNRKS